MRKCLISNSFCTLDEVRELCGINLLKGLKPIVLDSEDRPFEQISCDGELGEEHILQIADEICENHICLETESCKIIYDLGSDKPLDRIVISGFWNGENDFSLQEYKLYLSSDAAAVFSEDSLIVHYCNDELCDVNAERRNHCDQVFDLSDFKGQYMAIEVIKSNRTDSVARICHIGAYNHAFTEQLEFCKGFGQNLVSGKTPTVLGSFIKDLTPLTDGICFDEGTRISLSCDTEFVFKLPENTTVSAVSLVCSDKGADTCRVFAARDKERLFDDESLLETELCPIQHSHKGITAAVLALGDEIEPHYIGFSFKEGAFIDQLGVLAPLNISENSKE